MEIGSAARHRSGHDGDPESALGQVGQRERSAGLEGDPRCDARARAGAVELIADACANETRGSRILAFDIESDGTLGAPTVFADLGRERQPDGLSVDVEGGVWVGCVTAREFLRVVAGGTVTHRVAIEQGWAIAPALGGADGRTLYMVVDDTTVEGLVKGESTGWIMQARVDVPGAGSP